MTQEPLTDSARDQILNTEVAKYVSRGWTVQSSGGGMAVLSKQKRVGWFWNTVLTIVTAGLWLIYVIYQLANRKSGTKVIRVDAYGKVRVD